MVQAVSLPVRVAAVVQDALTAVEAAQSPVRAQLWELPQAAEAVCAERLRAEVVPSARQQEAAEAEPSVQRPVAVEAQLLGPPGEVAAVRPWEARVVEEAPRVEAQAAAEVQRAAVRVVEAEQPAAEPAAARVRPSEARAARLSAEPSVRSDRLVRGRLARRRMTTAFRREPALAQAERLRLQSSSAEGVECSS